MSPSTTAGPHTVGSSSFDPDRFFAQWDEPGFPRDDDLKSFIIRAFGLKADDNYVYHAIASVTLDQVQVAINAGGLNGMHVWYRDEKGEQVTRKSSPSAFLLFHQLLMKRLRLTRYRRLQQQIFLLTLTYSLRRRKR